MSIPRLADLREPPVPGKYYLVPTVWYSWFDEWRHWPVNGPLHHDRSLNFPWLHYHIDGRFLPKRYEHRLEPSKWYSHRHSTVNGSPIAEPSDQRRLEEFGPIPRQPTLRKMLCRRAAYGWIATPGDLVTTRLKEVYGADPLDAIRRPDGRALCPHRKVDLSQFPADDHGIVTCPLHGLKVRAA